MAAEMSHHGSSKKALVIANWSYSDQRDDLRCPEEDRNKMQSMLKDCEWDVAICNNCQDFRKTVREFVENQSGKTLDAIHFHYSGHGMYNVKVKVDKSSAIVTSGPEGRTETYSSEREEPGVGDCLVSTDGTTLYSVWELKRDLLKIVNCEKFTVTLDMCRTVSTRALPSGEVIEYVRVPEYLPIDIAMEEKIAIYYSTIELHYARDQYSFTQELCHLVKEHDNCLRLTHLVRLVNKRFRDMQVTQRCKVDFVEVEDNWEESFWPSSNKTRKEGEMWLHELPSNWKRFYFKLEDDQLIYTKEKKDIDTSHVEKISLKRASCSETGEGLCEPFTAAHPDLGQDNVKKNTFIVNMSKSHVVKNPPRIFWRFAADTEGDKDDWVRCINEMIRLQKH